MVIKAGQCMFKDVGERYIKMFSWLGRLNIKSVLPKFFFYVPHLFLRIYASPGWCSSMD